MEEGVGECWTEGIWWVSSFCLFFDPVGTCVISCVVRAVYDFWYLINYAFAPLKKL